MFRPYRSPADIDRYGRYGPILAESARFGANRSRFGTNRSRFGANRAASARIEPSRCESEKKKKKNAEAAPTRGQLRRTPRPASRCVRLGCGTLPAASVHSSLFVSVMRVKLIVPCSFFWFETKKKRKKRERERERNQRCIH